MPETLDDICARMLAILDCGPGENQIVGAAVGLLTASGEQATASDGFASIEPAARKMGPDIWFDLASLTKIMFTVPEVLRLVDSGTLELDDPLSLHLPDLCQYDLASPIRQLTIRQCLSHQTFLPAVVPLYTYGDEPERLKAYVLQHDWPASASVYSDINFILLGILIERMTGKNLRELPLSEGLSFAPPVQDAAATEFCQWRGRMICGTVHDENAHALGGVAGHAGLFGTMAGVLGFARTLLTDCPSGHPLRVPQSAERTLGWQVRHKNWPGGQSCSESTIGHTGFTGTGLWIDFDRGLAWTFLTNRVHPSRHRDTGIEKKRQQIGDLVVELFDALA